MEDYGRASTPEWVIHAVLGEAGRADIGIAGGNGEGLIFRKGEIIHKVKEADLVADLIKEIEKL